MMIRGLAGHAFYGADKIEEIVKKTIEEKPEDRTHWSTRSDGQGSWRRQDNRR